MTTDERIAALDNCSDQLLKYARDTPEADCIAAVAIEIRALRMMLRDEIREAAWRLAAPGQPDTRRSREPWLSVRLREQEDEALASRKAPLEDTP